MVRPRLALALCGLVLIGCSTFQKDGQWEPDVEKADDQWGDVSKEARGNRPVEKNRDPIDKMLRSDKAAEIERSLGYD